MHYKKDKLEQLRQRWDTPKGRELLQKIRKSRCYLSPVLFRQKVRNFPGITDKEVEDSIDLRGAPLSGFDFRTKIPQDQSGFSEEVAIISNIHFEGAILTHCNFEGGKIHNCYFEDSSLNHSEFRNARISNCHFQWADCTGISLYGAKLTNCNFNNTTIRDITLDSTQVDERTSFGLTLQSEDEGDFHAASIEYKQIKEMYKNSRLHTLYDEYHYKEMIAKRKSHKKGSYRRILSYIFGDLLSKYGTSFIRVFTWGAIVISSCAVVFWLSDGLLFDNTAVDASLSDSFYFSIITFSTLGYGDFHAIGPLRFVAAFESLLGATLMALFTVIAARKIIRD